MDIREAEIPHQKKERKPKEEHKEETKAEFQFIINKTRLNEVIGLPRQKMMVHKLIELPITNERDYEAMGLAKSTGIILYGPPGVGKTMLCKAISGELGIRMVEVHMSDIMVKYVGDSEKKVKTLFAEARENQPCVVFMDEFDALGGSRDNIGEQGQEMRGTITELLQQTSNIHEDRDLKVFMVAATNQPWNIDAAIKRSGRFDHVVYAKPPRFVDRISLLKYYVDPNKQGFGKHIDYWLLALATAEYSPADIEKICKVAKVNAIDRARRIKLKTGKDVQAILTTRTIQMALRSKEGGKSSLDEWYILMKHTYIGKSGDSLTVKTLKAIFTIITLGKLRKKRTEADAYAEEKAKGKFNKADMELYREMVEDVERHINHRFYIKMIRKLSQGL